MYCIIYCKTLGILVCWCCSNMNTSSKAVKSLTVEQPAALQSLKQIPTQPQQCGAFTFARERPLFYQGLSVYICVQEHQHADHTGQTLRRRHMQHSHTSLQFVEQCTPRQRADLLRETISCQIMGCHQRTSMVQVILNSPLAEKCHMRSAQEQAVHAFRRSVFT